MRLVTRSRIDASAWCGVRPSEERTPNPDAAWPISPATRTMKNSSSMFEKIEQNFTRSSNGTDRSLVRSSTRSLVSSHESSRLRSRTSGKERVLATTSIIMQSARGRRGYGVVNEFGGERLAVCGADPCLVIRSCTWLAQPSLS